MNALELVLLGTSSPIHTPHRFGPSQVITDGQTRIMVDTGWGSTLRLYQAAMPPQTIDAVFITHLHSDHTTDLADFLVMRWVGGTRGPIPIYGPAGTSRMVKGFQEAMAADTKYRLDHHGDKLWSGGLSADITEFEAGDAPVVIADIEGIVVKAFEVDHYPVKPAYGFRFEKDGRAITISGDTNPCTGLLNGSTNADIMVCDSMNQTMMKVLESQLRTMGNDVQAALLEDAHSYHAPIEAMADTAQKAGVKHLVISHVLPPVPEEQETQFITGLDQIFSGKITVGRDLMRLST
ncbi:MAG TPA: MBL fold metallo-hydrolase [Dehalococcoidia bacterium]|nr:MBL fold metallo-hydrolase [Dehalococcoidia bacterium]